MTCLGCEKRREWISEQLEAAKKSWRMLVQRNSPQVAGSNDSTESSDSHTKPSDEHTESTADFNRGSEQSIDESSSKSD